MKAPRAPIGAYGLIGDSRSAALVAPDGSIDWWCAPRFDDPPVFGRLVGGEPAGHFDLRPLDAVLGTTRAYRDHTVTLLATWQLEGGAELELADAMLAEVEGRLLPSAVLVRRLTARGRPVRALCDLVPRFGYERRPARRLRRVGSALLLDDGPRVLTVDADGLDVVPDRPVEMVVEPGRPVTVVLTVVRHHPAILVPPGVAATEVAADEGRWRAWVEDLDLGRAPARYRAALVRSLITLRLLTYSPSGAPVAAPTTSLPEAPGGARNWDYRYAWPRDACIGIAAFLGVGKPEEARSFLAWLLHAGRLSRPHLPVLFTLDGRRGPPETALWDWPGYAGSVPVRVGNGAAGQHQLDGYGWVLEAGWLLTAAGHQLYGETWRTLAGFADEVARVWTEPDAGIWEQRNTPAHHVHSKLMAWLALDRAIRIAVVRRDRRVGRRRRWERARAALGADVRRRGFDEARGTYTATYGSAELDAATLVLPLVGLDPVEGPRVRGTVDAVRRELGAGGPLLYRYPPATDGLEGGEGAFLPCSFWAVQALAVTGRTAEAEALLEQLLPIGGPLGLFAEEADPATGEQLGNYPQALTHSALVQAVLALSHSRDAVPSEPG
ncbi:MAG TPA: glycoside hydrolase family 15 protein [Microthrixaceae bacterium]|nr:glycoside hydrolase family 15 protein [Microthrixaceae bacterium]